MMSQRPLFIMAIYAACVWLGSGVTSSPVVLTSNGDDDLRSTVPVQTLPSGPTDPSEIGQPLTEEEFHSNISTYRGSAENNQIIKLNFQLPYIIFF